MRSCSGTSCPSGMSSPFTPAPLSMVRHLFLFNEARVVPLEGRQFAQALRLEELHESLASPKDLEGFQERDQASLLEGGLPDERFLLLRGLDDVALQFLDRVFLPLQAGIWRARPPVHPRATGPILDDLADSPQVRRRHEALVEGIHEKI